MRGCVDSATAAWRTTATRIQSANGSFRSDFSVEDYGEVHGRRERFRVPNQGSTTLPGQD